MIIEYGFADSLGDDVILIKDDWEELAEAVVRAVATYLNVPYVPLAGSNTYVVQKGDTLWSISRKYGISVNELKEANNLTDNSLSLKQVLIIPGLDDDEYYIVKSGDNLYNISKKYGLSVLELKKLNGLSSNVLSVGQKLLVKKSVMPDDDYDNYEVKSGDTLYSIASMFDTTVDEIKKINSLINNNLSIGQNLKLPLKAISNESIIHTVMAGDNLYQIARKYGVALEDLREVNNLVSDILSIGQKLIIPS